jgi:hypothetical protein
VKGVFAMDNKSIKPKPKVIIGVGLIEIRNRVAIFNSSNSSKTIYGPRLI